MNKQILLRSSLGSVFTTFGDNELAETVDDSKRLVALSGKVATPGLYNIEEGESLKDLIEKAGGLLNKRKFRLVKYQPKF